MTIHEKNQCGTEAGRHFLLKRIISMLLCLILLLSFCTALLTEAAAAADQAEDELQMTEDQLWGVYQLLYEKELIPHVTTEEWYPYISVSRQEEGNGLVKFSAWLTDRELDYNRSVQILTGMMTLLDLDCTQMLGQQSSVDTNKTFRDYALDVTNILVETVSVGTAFGPSVTSEMKTIAQMMGATWGLADQTIGEIETLECMSATVAHYQRYKEFLKPIVNYCDNDEVRHAASILLSGEQKLFYSKMNALIEMGESAAEFMGNDLTVGTLLPMLEDRGTDIWTEDELTSLQLVNKAADFITALKLGKDIGVFATDMLFGFSNEMGRIQEMIALRYVRESLIEQMSNYQRAISGPEDIQTIHQLTELLDILLYVDYRGEYCMTQMLVAEGQITSLRLKIDGSSVTFQTILDKQAAFTRQYSKLMNEMLVRLNHVTSAQEETEMKEISADSVEEDAYMVFLKEKRYEKYLSQPPKGYAMIDIDQDGVKELILESDSNKIAIGPCAGYDVFYYDKDNNEVMYIEHSRMDSGGLYQSVKYTAVCITWENGHGGFCKYYTIANGNMDEIFELDYDRLDKSAYIWDEKAASQKVKLEDSAFDEYMHELTLISFLPLPIEVTKNDAVLVSDAWNYKNSRLPQINLNGQEIQDINKAIYDKSEIDYAEKLDHWYVNYRWYRNSDTLSLIVDECYDGGYNPTSVYNVSIARKASLSSNDLISSILSMDRNEYEELARAAIASTFCDAFAQDIESSKIEQRIENPYIATRFKDAVSDATVNSAAPYLNEKGELCIMVEFASPAGPSTVFYDVNLVNYVTSPYVELMLNACMDEPINLLTNATSEEQRRVNLFLSNFSEQPCFSSYNSSTTDDELIDFAYLYNKINAHERIEYKRLETQRVDSCRISQQYVDNTLNYFFGRTVSHPQTNQMNRDGYDAGRYGYLGYSDGYYYWIAADGESYNRMTVADKMYREGDGSYIVDFTVYSIDLETYFAGAFNSLYALTSQQAKSDARLSAIYTGRATLVESTTSNASSAYHLTGYSCS